MSTHAIILGGVNTISTVTLLAAVALSSSPPPPMIAYTLRVDSARVDFVEVAIRIEHAPTTLRLAMKVHPEYDAKYWRYLDSLWVDGTADDKAAGIVRWDSTLWSVTLPGGRGVVHYRVHVQTSANPMRRAWQPFLQRTGGLINGPDFFLYFPDFARTPVFVELEIPHNWRVATALKATTTPNRFSAPDAAVLLDSPVLLGDLRVWSFTDRETRFHVVYWPLPDPAPFDTVALVDEVRGLTRATLDVFGRAPTPDFYFLLQDGASDALEHRGSVTLGISSAALALKPRASLTELAHEFFHTWNLIAIHPDRYGKLSYQLPARTTGLWWGEGVTLYYADALPRRAGLADSRVSRLDHLAQILGNYYAARWNTQVSPERASLAFGDSPITHPDATGGYYVQGELLGHELEALLRDSTQDVRGLDDVMRALFSESKGGAGFTSAGLERVADSVCRCRLAKVFGSQVRGASLIDMTPVVARLGLRLMIDSISAVDSAGAALPDLRLGVDFTQTSGPLRLVVRNPASVWSLHGLRTGDALTTMNGTPIATFVDLQRMLNGLRMGDTVTVDVRRYGRSVRVSVPVAVYLLPRVRFVEIANSTANQRARRVRWLAGW